MNNSRDERRIDPGPKNDFNSGRVIDAGPGGLNRGPDRHHEPAPPPPRHHHEPAPAIHIHHEPAPPPRHFRIIHRYGLGYDYGYGYEYGYSYDPDYFLPYDPKYVDNKRKIGVLAAISSAVAVGGVMAPSSAAFTLGMGGLAVASVASVVNKIKRKIRFEDQQREEYERGLAM